MTENLPTKQEPEQAPDVLTVAANYESQLLGITMAGLYLPDELPQLPSETWAFPLHAEAWGAIERLHRAGARLMGSLQVASAMQQGPTLAELDREKLRRHLDAYVLTSPIVGQRALAGTIDDFASNVRAFAAKRGLKAIGEDLVRSAEDPAISAVEALAIVETAMDRLRVSGTAGPTEFRRAAMERLEALERPALVMSTGFPTLDRELYGGLWAGKLYGIAARPKVGKTLTLATVARNVARAGQPVLYLALEMGKLEICDRLIADKLGINAVRFLQRDNLGDIPERLVAYAASDRDPELGNLMFRDVPGLNFTDLRVEAYTAVRRYGIKLLVVDYWQLIQGASIGQTETKHLGDVAQWMAEFVKRTGCALLTAAQINRSGETRGSDGLRLACDWYSHMHPAGPNDAKDRWIEILDSRYTMRNDIGTAEQGAFVVDGIGPVLAESSW